MKRGLVCVMVCALISAAPLPAQTPDPAGVAPPAAAPPVAQEPGVVVPAPAVSEPGAVPDPGALPAADAGTAEPVLPEEPPPPVLVPRPGAILPTLALPEPAASTPQTAPVTRPKPNPPPEGGILRVPLPLPENPVAQSPRPPARPDPGDVAVAPEAVEPPETESALAPTLAPSLGGVGVGALTGRVEARDRPGNRPVAAALPPVVPPAPLQPLAEAMIADQGTICGIAGISGRPVPPITDPEPECGVAEPVEVAAVEGVALLPASIMECATAAALRTWVALGVKPALGPFGGGVAGLEVLSHYECRNRNSRPEGEISEHGKGKAIDIAAVLLADGRRVSVKDDWAAGEFRDALRRAYGAACGTFGTTLGPGSDGLHEGHFHLDTLFHRSGPYCR